MHTVVTLSRVSFELPNGYELISELSFSLARKVTALVGPNGVGKTTLALLIAGELEPTRGSVSRRSAIQFFKQRETAPDVTVESYLGFSYSWSALAERLLAKIDRQSLCAELSGGQWMRVRLAKALGDSFIILDEPTNDLDSDGRSAVFEFLRENENGCLLISHDRECLALSDEVLELSNKGLSKFGGGWSSYTESRHNERSRLQEELESAKRHREAAQKDRQELRERQDKRNRKGLAAAAKGGLPRILIGGRKRRAQVTTGKVDVGTLARADEAVRRSYEAFSELKVDPIMYAGFVGRPIPAQKLVCEARDFNIRFLDWIYKDDLNFSWRGNIRMALKGANGSGKSTLVKAVLGQNFNQRGEIRSGELCSLYIDQKCTQLDEHVSVFENIRASSKLSETEIRNHLARFLFTGDKVFQRVKTLSGGERLRAALAKGFLARENPELLVLDEPTNNLDLQNIEFLEGFVRQFEGALLIISHDDVFLDRCQIDDEYLL